MSSPRSVKDRIKWFRDNKPSKPGMCAQHTWHSLGGDYGCPPRWFCNDANEVVDKIRKSGRFYTPKTWSGPPPRGAVVLWKYGVHGHMALSNGDGTITTTDPTNGRPTGIERMDYPKRWGYNTKNGPYTLWTDEYAGVRFPVGDDQHVTEEEDDDMALSDADVQRIAKAVWGFALDDPTWDDPKPVPARALLQRAVVLARSVRDVVAPKPVEEDESA